MKRLPIILFLVLATVHVAYADSGFYAGISIGQSEVDDWCDGVLGSCDDEDSGYKVYAGSQVTKNWGIEVSFIDFGEVTATDTSLGFPLSAKGEANGFGVVGTGSLPISEQFSVFGKVGIFRWDIEVSASGNGASISLDETGTDLTYGIGARFNFTERVGIRVEWEQFADVGDADTTGESDLTLLSAGVVFSF